MLLYGSSFLISIPLLSLGLLVRPAKSQTDTSGSSSSYNGGYAIRREGGCLVTEVDCGPRVSPFHACCAHGQICNVGDNTSCCPENEPVCNITLVARYPKCANPSWTFCDSDSTDGFCCLENHLCYSIPLSNGNTGDGCGAPGYNLLAGQNLVPTIIPANEGPGGVTSGSSSISRPTSASTATSSISTIPAISGSTPTTSVTMPPDLRVSGGAIAGIVVGTCLFLTAVGIGTLLVFRKRRASLHGAGRFKLLRDEDKGMIVHEIGGSELIRYEYELPDQPTERAELVSHQFEAPNIPVELPS